MEIFRCSCGQEYLSFSALYLHNKKKHNIFLKTSQKEAAYQKKIWCGKKIKKIYDFSEDIEVDIKKDH